MKGNETQRLLILERIADYLLAHGLGGASLRPMAAAAGTSDRMLLYYFANKEELLAAALSLISQRLLVMLESAQGKPMPFEKLLPHLVKVMGEPSLQPYMAIWFELVAMAGRGDEGLKAIGGHICDGFLKWIAAALVVRNESERIPQAALLLATVDGLSLLVAVGRDDASQAALKGIAFRARAR